MGKFLMSFSKCSWSSDLPINIFCLLNLVLKQMKTLWDWSHSRSLWQGTLSWKALEQNRSTGSKREPQPASPIGCIPGNKSSHGLHQAESSCLKECSDPDRLLAQNVYDHISDCRDCLSLLVPVKDGRDNACVRRELVNDLLSMVAELKEKVES